MPRRDSKTPVKHGGNGLLSEVGAISGASAIQSGASWTTIKDLIEACPDLSPAARRKLIAVGDGGRDEQQPDRWSPLKSWGRWYLYARSEPIKFLEISAKREDAKVKQAGTITSQRMEDDKRKQFAILD
jgi:hypothetical protein